MASSVIAWTVLFLAGLSAAAPTISFPINSQVPPVARVGRPFSFVFSQSTFTSSSSSTIKYTLATPPKWLFIDSDARRLFGTPSETDITPGDVVGVPVNLVATDNSGSTTLAATLVVSRRPGPTVNITLDQQVPPFGIFSRPSSILSPPGTQFTLDLSPATFSNPSGRPLNYYAVTGDHTPLPAWVSFDPVKLSFSGRTPPSDSLIQPPQPFAFQLLASDVVGFSDASLGFDIVVGNHEITASSTTIVLNATEGSPVLFTGLRDSVKVDGNMATSDSVIIAYTRNLPPWLSVDRNSWQITGVPPEAATSTNFTIALTDKFSDTLNITVTVEVANSDAQGSGLFKGDIPVLIATAGEHFSFDVGPYLAKPEDTELSIAAGSSSSWLQSASGATTISGDVPLKSIDSVVGITIKARSRSSGSQGSLFLTVNIRGTSTEAGRNVPTLSTDGSALQPTPTGNGTSSVTSENSSSPLNVVLLAVLVPILLLLLAIICILFWCFRRRKERQRSRLKTRDISGPLPGSFTVNTSEHSGPSSLHEFTGQQDGARSINEIVIPGHRFPSETRADPVETSMAELPRPLATVRLLSSKESARSPKISSKDSNAAGVSGPSFLTSATVAPLRPRKQGKNTRSLNSTSETSLYDESGTLGEDNTLILFGNSSRTSFRDAIEINIPSLGKISSMQPTPDSAYTGEESSRVHRTDSGSFPLGSSFSVPRSEPEILPLRPKSRIFHHPPAFLGRKFAWPWLKVAGMKGKTPPIFGRGAKKHASHVSSSSIDTFAHSSMPTASPDRHRGLGNLTSYTMSPAPRVQLPGLPFSMRPVTRRGPDVERGFSSGSEEITEGIGGNESVGGPVTATSTGYNLTPGKMDAAATATIIDEWHQPPRDSLGISYSDIVRKAPFHPSKTWSTVPSHEDRQSEATESHGDLRGVTPNKSSLQVSSMPSLDESPVIRGWTDFDAGHEDMRRKGGGGDSRGGPSFEKHSRSQGISLISEASKESSDYAVLI
ncbi:hypothetical protein B0T17DRAFT_357564 [Bombardia bombarda]|uniref:Dystroglycan-type cadherin-like domain-containing protein n=1 Tax=Bombardia bombarda TaxID=252184 RepID=A0AA40BW17_9PEZI|nr:hypothetical protein B0T17DRAFT_357564 [Bombardia bombarda]